MEWRALEEHFREALTQDPGPFGDDAIEWDYSRYARALGLTGEPGAHDLPHRSCVVASLPPARWDAAQKRIAAWAEARGWSFWSISARPTVAVPDPITYALGLRAAGTDALAFAPATRAGVPAIARRPRAVGMPFPLTAGERWLIATDRVRRRARTEIGMRGRVLFVEEAEWLTPAGLAVLMYLLDAQRAWKARMLARPARVYVVLATAPRNEASVVRMLGRFHLNGNPAVLRERRRAEAGAGAPTPAPRDAEEEYLLGALAAAPAALSADDVRAAFGASAVDRCRAMAERDLLRERVEAGHVCYAVPPAVAPSGLPAPRALSAIAEIYRKRARRGHEHLGLAAAAVSLMLGRPLRAIAAVARMPHTAGAMLPLRLFETLDPVLAQARPRLRPDHMAAWFSLAAHQRVFEEARELANVLTEFELRTWKELYRIVRLVLCTGRTLLDTCLPPDFWPRLKSERIAGSFMDATCVLSEFFWRKRYLDNSEIRQRFEFARDCFEREGVDRPDSAWFDRLEEFGRLMAYRAALHLDTPTRILCSAESPHETLRSFLRAHPMPAYLMASTVFAEAAVTETCMRRSFDGGDRYFAMSLDTTTGHPGDLLIGTGIEGGRLSRRDYKLLLRDTFDDLLLLVNYRANPADRHEGGRFLLYVAGGRGWLAGTNAVYRRHGRQDIPGRDAFDELAVAQALMRIGDLVGARDQLMAALARGTSCPLLLAEVLSTKALLAGKALDVELLSATRGVVAKYQRSLGPEPCAYLNAFIGGTAALCAADFASAHRCFMEAYAALPGSAERAVGLKKDAMALALRAGYVQRILKAWSTRGSKRPTIWKVIRTLCAGLEWRTASPSLRARASVCMDHLCGIIDAWASVGRDEENVLRIALFLKDSVDAVFRPLGREFLQLMATWAPRFYERLRAAVITTVGDLGVAAPEARALGAAMRTIDEAWKHGDVPFDATRCNRVRICSGRSQARQARHAAKTWHDDATTYSQLWDAGGRIRTCPGGERVIVAYGYVGCTGSKPVATALRFAMSPVEDNSFDVDVETQPAALRSMAHGQRQPPRRSESKLAFFGRSEAARKVHSLIDTAARCSYPALILGETGVGKDLVARCIHVASGRSTRPLVTAECAGVVESLLESELFGHEKGAFTGAHAVHQGVFERADGSTLLLDDADSMPRRMQAAVLRALESGEYRRVGASSARKSEFRLITAALPRLLGMVETGEFRQDLFYRISTLRIEIPPLREREGDAEEIAEAHARSLGRRLTAGARRAIAGYEWPGNVRQLHHCIQAAALHATDGRIGEAAMAEVIAAYRGGQPEDRTGRQNREAAWTKALRALERVKRFGTGEFAKAADLSRRSAQRHIARLIREGRIVRTGAGRATRYGLRN